MPRNYASSEVSDRDTLPPPSSHHHHRARSRGNVAEYDEVDIREHRRRAAPEPDFLREDYGRRSEAGALVVRERERSRDRERPRRGGGSSREEEEVVIERREKSRERPRRREREFVEEEEAVVVEKPRRREREVVEEEVVVPVGRRRGVEEEIVYRDEGPPRPVRTERENFEFYRRERDFAEREEVVLPPVGRREPVAPMAPMRSEREVFEYRPKIREPSPEPERREEIIIKEERRERERPRYREDDREEEIIIKEDRRERPRYTDDREEEIIIRERSRERPRYREDEEIIIREREREREQPRYLEERDSLTVRTDERVRARSRGGFEESDALVVRRTEGGGRSGGHSRAASRGDFREEEITIREREREPPRRVRSPSRDREEITFRHDDRGGRHNDEIVIRRNNERSPSPESSIRDPEPIMRPPVVQEVITHHRHIDHGFERAPSPPRPRSPSPVRDERIEIRHRSTAPNGRRYDDDIIFERERGNRRELEGVHRGNDRYSDEDYTSQTLIRTTDRERERDLAVGPPVRYEARQERKDRLWTEITKDLVSEEAIREKGFEYEEAETSWFVMEHLRYDDVLALTELTEEIRLDRRDRISEIQAERELGPLPPRRPLARGGGGEWDEERIVEREIIYDGPPGGGGGPGPGRRGPGPGGLGRGYR